MVVLGKTAQLHTRDPIPQKHGAVSAAAAHQWLLFNPMEKAEAETLFEELKARLPVLSLRMRASFRIGPYTELATTNVETYNGPAPTLIPASFRPTPLWMDASMTSEQVGWQDWLDNCPAIRDEGLLAALSLYVSAKDEALPRSKFLTYLTILDSLAVQWSRDAAAIAWINEKRKETVAVNDKSLSGALGNLKKVSHGAAVRALVTRAAKAQGYEPEEIENWDKQARDLYKVRSDLSHAGESVILDVSAAQKTAELVLEQAVLDPSLLDPPVVKPEEGANAMSPAGSTENAAAPS
ncbi:hypothetical protein [Paraburkholderia bannensis]|uniref:hypothetical protein n=1 Tax=Paraburkholderia bannensis TaxID=765414 RepID=UPI0005A6B59A|nr:hypothetical protein [Paraburkholderia bannensis]